MVKKTSNKYSDKKLVWFHDKMESFRSGEVLAPIYVRIKPINSCNHRCFFCVYNADYSAMHGNMSKKDTILKEKMLEVLRDFRDMGVKATTYTGGGESLLHPDIVEFMETTKEYGMDLSIITNAQLLNGDRAKVLYDAKWVRVSMDYYNEDLFHETRSIPKDKFHKIIENIISFNENKILSCDLSINYIITKSNCYNVYEAVEFFKDLKVDNIRLCPVWTKDFVEYHKDIKDEVTFQIKSARDDFQSETFKVYDSYRISEEVTHTEMGSTGKYVTSPRKYSKCYIMQTIPVIGADCKVYTCHNKAYDDQGIIGDISNQTFKEMWFSDETKKFFESFNAREMCHHQCTNDSKNIFLHEMVDCYGDNFV